MKKILFGLLSLSMLFTACTKEEDITPLKVLIEGKVLNSVTHLPIEGVVVEIKTKNTVHTATSNADGYYAFDHLPSGNYVLWVKQEGYLNVAEDVRMRYSAVNENTELITISEDLILSPLTHEIDYTVEKFRGGYYGTSLIAANVPYTIIFHGPNESISGTTDELGQLKISNLPAEGIDDDYTLFKIHFDFVENSVRYTGQFNGHHDDQKIVINNSSFVNGEFTVSSSNLKTPNLEKRLLSANEPIIIKLTQPVDVKSATAIISSGPEVKLTWEEGNTKLTITPISALDAGRTYLLKLNLSNEDLTQSLASNYWVITEPTPVK